VGTSIFRVADKDFYFNPSPEFRLEINDLIVVIGHPYHVLHFRERIDKNQM
jgi:Trk K+ transport system NAD-binding subunit